MFFSELNQVVHTDAGPTRQLNSFEVRRRQRNSLAAKPKTIPKLLPSSLSQQIEDAVRKRLKPPFREMRGNKSARKSEKTVSITASAIRRPLGKGIVDATPY